MRGLLAKRKRVRGRGDQDREQHEQRDLERETVGARQDSAQRGQCAVVSKSRVDLQVYKRRAKLRPRGGQRHGMIELGIIIYSLKIS